MSKNELVINCQSLKGFSLIELMIAVVIVAIIAAVAVPSYQDSVRKSRRADASIALGNLQMTQEKYRANNATYGTLAEVGGAGTSTGGYYTITVSDNTATGYILTATAVAGSSQASDTGCTAMTLTQAGEATTYGPSITCWK